MIWHFKHLYVRFSAFVTQIFVTCPLLTNMCAETAWKRLPWDHLHHRIVPHFSVVPQIGSAGSSWLWDRRHKWEQLFLVHQQGSLSLHHYQSLLFVQEEGLFTHRRNKYQYVLVTYQVPFLIIRIFLWMHSHQSVSIALVHHTRNLSLWTSGQAWHALPYHITFFRDNFIQNLKSS